MTAYRPILSKPKPAPRPKKNPKALKQTKGTMDGFNKPAFVAARGPFCQCGCGEHIRDNVMDAHHALFPRSKKYPELNAWENLVLVTHYEHVVERKFQTLEWRRKFWTILCDIYGHDHMTAWLATLPQKLQGRIDFIYKSGEVIDAVAEDVPPQIPAQT